MASLISISAAKRACPEMRSAASILRSLFPTVRRGDSIISMFAAFNTAHTFKKCFG